MYHAVEYPSDCGEIDCGRDGLWGVWGLTEEKRWSCNPHVPRMGYPSDDKGVGNSDISGVTTKDTIHVGDIFF